MRIGYLFLALFLFTLANGCQDDDPFSNCEHEGVISLDDYIAQENLMNVQQTPEGLRYIIEDPGSNERPTINSRVSVNYRGYLTNDETFDQTNGSPLETLTVGQFIAGWQIGLPLIGKGGKIKLLIPSELGYGFRGSRGICPNTDLVFDIELINFTQ